MNRRLVAPVLVSLALVTWVSEPAVVPWDNASQMRTNWIALWPLLGVAGALFATFCAFRLRNRAMIGVSIAGALLYVAQFYYLLGTTLLIKSGIMLSIGAAALLAAHWLGRQTMRNESEAS